MANVLSVQLQQVGPSTSEGTVRGHRIVVDRPTAKGGADAGPMGGELFLAALGGCFASNLLAAIRAREAKIGNVTVVVKGSLEASPARFSAIRLEVTADYSDRALMEKLVAIAERGCVCSNTLAGAVQLSCHLA